MPINSCQSVLETFAGLQRCQQKAFDVNYALNKIFYLQQSSVCRAGLHAGVIDNDGGWMDVTRQGRKDFFIKSNKNGVQSLGWANNIRKTTMNLY